MSTSIREAKWQVVNGCSTPLYISSYDKHCRQFFKEFVGGFSWILKF